MALTPQQIQAFNQVTGWNTPTTTPAASPSSSRAAQILALGKASQPTIPSVPTNNSQQVIGKDLQNPSGQAPSSNDAFAQIGTEFGGGPNGIANKLASDVQSGAADIQKGGLGNVIKGEAKAGFRTAGDVAGAVFAPVGAVVSEGLQATGAQAAIDKIGSVIGDKISNWKPLQDWAVAHPNAGEDFGRAMNLALGAADQGKIEPSTAVERTVPQVKAIGEGVSNTASSVADAAGAAKDKVFGTAESKAALEADRSKAIYDKRAADIKNIENSYVKGRKINNFSDDEGNASRQRIAASDVLVGSVDKNGLIRTMQPGGAYDQYKAMTLDNAEGVVRKGLVREGSSAPIKSIEKVLTDKVSSSGLEGADLKAALNRVKQEVSGIKLRADADGRVPLERVHDAKINQTNNIDFNTPKEVETARKAIASGLKKIVEDNSSLPIKDTNEALSQPLKDLERLKELDGKRVEGGRLGKHFAKIGGQAVGALAGSILGGPFTSLASGYLGGEISNAIKGRFMENTFGGETRGSAAQDPRITKAVQEANSPRLALPPGRPNTINNGEPIPVFPREGGQIDYTDPNSNVVIPSERVNGKGPNIDSERMSLLDTALTQQEKTEIYNLSPEEVHMLNAITDKSERARLVKDYIANQSQRLAPDSSQSSTENPTSKKAVNTIDTSVTQAGDKSSTSLNTGDIVKLPGINGDFKVVRDEGAMYRLKNAKTGQEISVGKDHVIPKGFSSGAIPERTMSLAKFQGYEDLTNKTLDALQGKSSVSKAFITDTLKQDGVKEAERTIVNDILKQYADQKTIPVQEFADKVKAELLPLKVSSSAGGEPRYENIALPKDIRGNVAKYEEHVYQSPVKTSAGNIHFSSDSGDNQNYFGHTRTEDMATNTKDAAGNITGLNQLRRVIEVQSDLYQKGNLEGEKTKFSMSKDQYETPGKLKELQTAREKEIKPLQQYNDPSAHFRMVREEVKQAAIDGKTKLQFPTGETAMKIEGLGEGHGWYDPNDIHGTLTPEKLDTGMVITSDRGVHDPDHNDWIITKVGQNGEFTAIPKHAFETVYGTVPKEDIASTIKSTPPQMIENMYPETFNIGKTDSSNPIYKFYDSTLGKYLQKTYKASVITDPQGVKWFQMDVPKSAAKAPVLARRNTKNNLA